MVSALISNLSTSPSFIHGILIDIVEVSSSDESGSASLNTKIQKSVHFATSVETNSNGNISHEKYNDQDLLDYYKSKLN